MKSLNLPQYSFNIKSTTKEAYIFDQWRNKYVFLSPEEWVRQNFLWYLIEERGYPKGRIAVEQSIQLYQLSKRCDAIIYDQRGAALGILECKSYNVSINQQVFDQISRYAIPLKVPVLMITNGLTHYCCQLSGTGKYSFLDKIPFYTELL